MKNNEIKRDYIDSSWEYQKERFSSILLTSAIYVFEDYIDRLTGLASLGTAKQQLPKTCSFRLLEAGGRNAAYTRLGPAVLELSGVFTAPAVLGKWYSGPHLESLLKCYRFFKETRNALIHNGGRATPELVAAHGQFMPTFLRRRSREGSRAS